MNEVTTIHLGRQPFTVSVDAYKALQGYLEAIKRQVGKQSKDVLEEVELRMAELLHERGIDEHKVILPDDVEFLQQQLGQPDDFKEEAEAGDSYQAADSPKRLYRDTDHAMFAGVASGLAAYFNIDAAIIRILFVVAAISAGWGVLLYILMWLIIPEAKTPSERLQMHGKAVTVESIKEVIGRADVKGAAERAGQATGKAVNGALKGVGALVGLALMAAGAAVLLAELTIGTYLIIHGAQVNDQVVFPIGVQEMFVVACALTMVAMLGLLLLLGGAGLLRRTWSLPGWATAVLVTLFFASAGVGAAVAVDVAPQVSHRVDAAEQTFTTDNCRENIFSYCATSENDQTEAIPGYHQ